MLYAAGSLLFAFTLIGALTVTFTTFARYRMQALAALRTLSLDSVHSVDRSVIGHGPSGLPLRARPDRRPARPALWPMA